MNTLKKNLIFGLLILLLAFSLASCGQKEAEVPTEVTVIEPTAVVEPTEQPAEEPTVAVEPTAEEAPMPEQSTIVILVPEDPTGFNGLLTDTGYEQLVGELVMLSVAEVDPMGNVIPEIAAEIPTLENGGVEFDEENWTMNVIWKIRDDVYWADGEQLTVDDIIFSWNVITDPDNGTWTDGLDYTDSIEKIDDFTFKVFYNTVYTAYQTQFGGENFFVYPEHYCDASQGFFEWDCDKEPLSSGPFMLEEWVTNDHLTFVKNPNYFEAGKPGIDRVIVQIIPEQTVRKTLMLEGDADLHVWPPDAIWQEYENAPDLQAVKSPTERWVMRFIPNLAARGETDPVENPHPFLSDVRVRQAIRHAINVDTLIEDIFLGHGVPVWTEFFRPPYICDIPRPEYSPQGAIDLLEEAGWTDSDGDGVRECRGCETAEEGTPMAMELAIYAEYGEELELAQQLVAEDLKAVGFDVTLQIVEGAVLWDPESGTEIQGNFDMDMWDDGYPGIDPTDNQLWYYYHTDASDPESGGWNVMRWQNEDFDALYDELFTLDEEYRTEVFCQIATLLDEEVPQILLFSTLEMHGLSGHLNGVLPSVNDTVTWNIADWTLSE
ncbi:MAG TPA: peptide ABC transporter substrate-binding protein [Anaerolineales bacterium]